MDSLGRTNFIAIGVGQGDAFFFEKDGKTALIDGGRARLGFAKQFERVTGLDGVDILVCSHNDADHAQGLIGFLESGLEAKEVWLPASWTDRLEDLLLRPYEFLSELVLNIKEAKIPKEISLSKLGDYYAIREEEKVNERLNEVNIEYLENVLETVSDFEDIWEIEFDLFNLLPFYPYSLFAFLFRLLNINNGKLKLLLEALCAGNRIRNIVLLAYHSGALIRWFNYNEFKNEGGKSDFLIPINSEEVIKIKRPRRTALEYLALTTSNKESLVFMSPSTNDTPAILFTADSDLSFKQKIDWESKMLITAPHHGSKLNAYAYKRFKKDTNNKITDVVWVRSDMKSKRRPCELYLKAPGKKYCTICRSCNLPKQNVRLIYKNNRWVPISTRECCCK